MDNVEPLNHFQEKGNQIMHGHKTDAQLAKAIRNDYFQLKWDAAMAIGLEAGNKSSPNPMWVTDGRGGNWEVSGGVCGFAWLEFAGNTAFGKWAKETQIARAGYPTGLRVSCWEFGQSLTRKEHWAVAVANYLREELHIEIRACSRID